MKNTEYFARVSAQNLRRAVGNISGHERKILARAAQLQKEHGIGIEQARKLADCTNEQWDRFLHLLTNERFAIDDASRISRYDLARQERILELKKNNVFSLAYADQVSGYDLAKQQAILQFIAQYQLKFYYKGFVAEKILSTTTPNNQVTSIDLYYDCIGNEGAIALAEALKDPNCKVTSINTGRNEIGYQGASALAESLKDPNCKVTSIQLGWNQIGNQGASALAEALKDPNCKVTEINLWNNQIGKEGAIALAEALKDPNCKVTSIDLQHNHINRTILNQIHAQLKINKARAGKEQNKQQTESAAKQNAKPKIEQKAAVTVEEKAEAKSGLELAQPAVLNDSQPQEEISDAMLEDILREFTDEEIAQLVGGEFTQQQVQERQKQEQKKQQEQQQAQELATQQAEAKKSAFVAATQAVTVDFNRIVELEKIVLTTAASSQHNRDLIAKAQSELEEIDAKYRLSAADRAEIDHIASSAKLQQYYQRMQRAVNETFAAAAIMSSGEFAKESSDNAKFLSRLSDLASSVPFAASFFSVASQVSDKIDGSLVVGKLIKMQNLNQSGNPLDAAIFAERLARRLAITNEAEIAQSSNQPEKISGIVQFFRQAQEKLTNTARKQVSKINDNFALGFFGEELSASELVALDDGTKVVDFVTTKKVEETKNLGTEISRGNQDLVIDQITKAVFKKTPVKMTAKKATPAVNVVAPNPQAKAVQPSNVANVVLTPPPAPTLPQNQTVDLMEMFKQMQNQMAEQARQIAEQTQRMIEQERQNEEMRHRIATQERTIEVQGKTIETLKAESASSKTTSHSEVNVDSGGGLMQARRKVQSLRSDQQDNQTSALSEAEQRRLAALETQVSNLSTKVMTHEENIAAALEERPSGSSRLSTGEILDKNRVVRTRK